MVMASRSWIALTGAAALISSQAAWAAPAASVPPSDPLVSLSLLASPESHAAVCGTAGACAVPAGMPSSAVAGAAAAAAAQGPGDRPAYGLDWPGLFVLFAVPVAIVLSIALEGNGNEPVSPA